MTDTSAAKPTLTGRILSGEVFSPFRVAVVVVVAVIIFLLVYPLGHIGARMLNPPTGSVIDPFLTVFGSATFWSASLNTVIVVVIGGGLALGCGGFFAWLNERTDARIPFISRALPLVPLLLPGTALTIGWIFLGHERIGFLNGILRSFFGIFGVEFSTGPINIISWPGLVFTYALYMVPFAFLVISAALRNIDPAMEEASRISGASIWRTIVKVSLPAVKPSILRAILLMAIAGLSVFSIPAIIGRAAQIEVLSAYTVYLVREGYPARLEEGIVVSLVIVGVMLLLWSYQRRLAKQERHATIRGSAGSSQVELGRWRTPMRSLLWLYIAATALLPLIALIIVALQPYWTPTINFGTLGFQNFTGLFEGRSITFRALQNSVMLGLVGATLGMAIAAVIAAYQRNSSRFGGEFVDGLTKIPGALTGIVIGVAFLAAFAGPPFNLHGTIIILLMAYIVISLPEGSVSAGAASEQVGKDLTEASSICGAGHGRTFRKVTLPLMLPGLGVGWAFLYVTMVGDLTASALLAGTSNPVVGFVMLDVWEAGTYSTLAVLALIVSAISMLMVGLVLKLGGGRGQTRAPLPRAARKAQGRAPAIVADPIPVGAVNVKTGG